MALKPSMWREDSYANRRMGILLLSLAGLAFTTLDATVKWLVQLQTLPLLELIWLRFFLPRLSQWCPLGAPLQVRPATY